MDWMNAITSVGFPIVACIAMAIFVKKELEHDQQTMSELVASHKEESKEWQAVLKENTKAINDLRITLAGKGALADEQD